MLSPTLPPKIEAALAREDQPRSRTDSNTSTSSTDKKVKSHVSATSSSLKPIPGDRKVLTPDLKAKPVTKSIPKPSLASSAVFKSELKKEATAKSDSPIRKISDEHRNKSNADDDVKSRTSTAGKAALEPEKESWILRLKYGKKRRQHIERILRLPPKPARDPPKPKPSQALEDASRARASSGASQPTERRDRTELSSKSKESGLSKGDARKTVGTPLMAAKKTVPSSDRAGKSLATPEKRSRTDDGDYSHSVKRQKLPANLDLEKHPRTPVQPPLISPSIQKSTGSLKSAAHLTPRDSHLKGAAMSRTASNETTVSTPGNRSYLTPQPKSGGVKGPTSAPLNSRGIEQGSLRALSRSYNELGRKLKKENEKIYKDLPKGQHMSETDRKRMALLGLECILSYMLAYAIEDTRRKLIREPAEIDGSWNSMLPLFRYMGNSTKHFRHLEGLRYHCGVAICARIQAVIAEKFARPSSSTAPPSSQEGRDKSDSPHSTSTHDPFTAPTTSAKLMETHATTWKDLTDFQREAASKLPVEELMAKFPKTWEKRAIGVRESGWESLTGRDGEPSCTGKFWLPIAVDSSTLQAARFGIGLLREWVKNDGLAYEVQVKL
jgi:hypothetical protein